jgi:signal transduction histidine kinase
MVVGASLVGVVYLAVGLGILALLREPARTPEKPESPWLAMVIAGFTLWHLSLGITYQLGDLAASMVAWNGRYIAATVMAVGWLLLAVAYITERRPHRFGLGLLGAYAVVDVALIATNAWHGLVVGSGTEMIGTVPDPAYASWFWVHTTVNYLFVFGATLLFAIEWARSEGLRRTQSGVLTLGFLPPCLANVATLTGVVDVPYDVTPFGLAVTALVLTYAIYRMDLLDVVPIARETAVEEMRDAVVTVDDDLDVVDANAAARRLFDVDSRSGGVSAEVFFEPLETDVGELFDGEGSVETRLEAHIDGHVRHFSASSSAVGTDGEAGQVIVLRDVTPIIRRERALEEREAELDLLRQVLTRVLTHNVRNALTTIHGNAELLAEEIEGAEAERVHAIVHASDDLLAISEKVRHVERILADEEPVQYDLAAVVEDAVADLREEYPGVGFVVDAPDTCAVRSSPGLDAAVTALLENAAEYNDPDDPRVAVTVDPDGPKLTVRDRGPGIPPAEVDVIEAERETDLQHGSGLGLWLVKWVADNSGGDLTFDVSGRGTTVRLSFDGEPPEHTELS